jgi:3-oxoacid CoA-transferase B subunit
MIRGGHLDVSVLGAMQVDEEGNLANWMVAGGRMVGMGGAMDLVSGAKRVVVLTEHCAKDGSSKILKKCNYPLTGAKCVDTIITELAVIKVTPDGLVLKEISPDITVEELKAKTDAELIVDEKLTKIAV